MFWTVGCGAAGAATGGPVLPCNGVNTGLRACSLVLCSGQPLAKLVRTKRNTPAMRHQVALFIRTKELVVLGNLYRVRMGIPLLQIKHKLTHDHKVGIDRASHYPDYLGPM